jgi:GNAT superfamily N-acetyltransferase
VSLELTALTGSSLAGVIPDLARLRIEVFRAFPYLYEGTLEYEARYLQTYLDCPQSLVVVVRDDGRVVGASSALPMRFETAEVQQPFLEAGFDVNEVFYLAESVLLPEYRGRGLGHRFFDAREAHARQLGGFRFTTFCAVQRPSDHPRRPSGDRSLEEFWKARGYEKREDLRTHFSWQEIGEDTETLKPMTFWLKPLEP